MARKLSNFSTDNKIKTIVVRTNNDTRSHAVIKCPIRNYEDLLDKTTIHHSYMSSSPNIYFKELLKVGGVA